MTNNTSIPPLRDLPPGREQARKQHLLEQITTDTRTPRPWPFRLGAARRQRFVLLPIAAALVAIGVGIAVSVRTSTSSASILQGALTPKLGVRVELPAGWSGKIYNDQPTAGSRAAFVHVANFALPPGDDDFGTKATSRMRATSVLIVLLETPKSDTKSGFHYARLTAPLSVSRSDFLPLFQGVPPTHAFARRLFSVQGRRFMLWVQFGRKEPGALLAETNAVLRTIQIAPLSK